MSSTKTPIAKPNHRVLLPDLGYHTTVECLLGVEKALREDNKRLEKECEELKIESEQLGAVLVAVQAYLPKQSVPYLLAEAVRKGSPL